MNGAGVDPVRAHSMSRVVAAVGLVLVVAGIAWAGLRPFDFAPPNRVAWIGPGPGLRFEGGGIAVSVDELRWDTTGAPAEFTLEVWLRADRMSGDEQRCILVLVDDSPTSVLGIRQEGTDLVVWDRVINPDGERWYNDFRLSGVLRADALQHLTIISAKGPPRFFVDGSEVEPVEGFGIRLARAGAPFAGRLIVGAGPPWIAPWSGEVLGLVLCRRALPADGVRRHAGLAPGAGVASLGHQPGVLALYAFDDGEGARVRNHVDGGFDLELPEHFRPPGKKLLALPDPGDWSERWHAVDVCLNLLGFMPLGYLLAIVLGRGRSLRPRVILWSSAVVGFAMSLGIELSQVLMVTRNSSSQDLVLNTLGTVLGAWGVIRRIASKP